MAEGKPDLLERGEFQTDLDGMRLVLKPLGADCLYKDGLHPAIAERLAKVRDIAHRSVATLRGVERIAGKACLVWSFVEGSNFRQAVLDRPESAVRLARDALVSLELLHGLGIVHGAVHERNLIVTRLGEVWWTHVSPYLYVDPVADFRGFMDLLLNTLNQDIHSNVIAKLSRLNADRLSGNELLEALSEAIPEISSSERAGNSMRWTSVGLALLVLSLAIAGSWFIGHRFSNRTPAGDANSPRDLNPK